MASSFPVVHTPLSRDSFPPVLSRLQDARGAGLLGTAGPRQVGHLARAFCPQNWGQVLREWRINSPSSVSLNVPLLLFSVP